MAKPSEQSLTGIRTAVLGVVRHHPMALLLALTLHISDIVSTHIGLGLGLEEVNVVPARVLAMAGEGAMFVLKLSALLTVLLLIGLLEHRYPRVWHAVHITNALMTAVVFSNSLGVLAR